MNELERIKKLTQMTDKELAEIIRERSGVSYTPEYLANVRCKSGVMTTPLRLALRVAFPEEMEHVRGVR